MRAWSFSFQYDVAGGDFVLIPVDTNGNLFCTTCDKCTHTYTHTHTHAHTHTHTHTHTHLQAANVSVKGQTMVDWFVNDYMLGPTGAGNPSVVGYYIDDGWAADVKSNAHGPSECDGHWQEDTGMTASQVDAEIAAFRWVADKVYVGTVRAPQQCRLKAASRWHWCIGTR